MCKAAIPELAQQCTTASSSLLEYFDFDSFLSGKLERKATLDLNRLSDYSSEVWIRALPRLEFLQNSEAFRELLWGIFRAAIIAFQIFLLKKMSFSGAFLRGKK